jgi:aubergine
MTGRGRGIYFKPETCCQEEEENDSVSKAYIPGVGRGRGSLFFKKTPSDVESINIDNSEGSSTIASAKLGRGHGIISFMTLQPKPLSFSTSDPVDLSAINSDLRFADANENIDNSSRQGTKMEFPAKTKAPTSGLILMFKVNKLLIYCYFPLEGINSGPEKNLTDQIKKMEIIELQTAKEESDSNVVFKHGTKGVKFSAMTNSIIINCDKNFGVFEYEVCFEPIVDSLQLRRKYLRQLEKIIGNIRTFDGVTLYFPKQIPDECSQMTCEGVDGNEINVNFNFRRKKRLGECLHLYNVLFERIMNLLQYQRVGRKCFDPSSPKIIPQHKLEVWPGYVKVVEELEGGLMLTLDVSHRVLSQKTVHEHIVECMHKCRDNWTTIVKKSLIGSVVMTRYNNKTYRIDDIFFDQNPSCTFSCRNDEIKFSDYYKINYNIAIQDMKQPLLFNRQEVRMSGQRDKKEINVCLIPELCYLTGLTDEMRNNFSLMKDLATYTKMSPYQRTVAYKNFIDNINNNDEAKDLLSVWGLHLELNPKIVTARVFDDESVIFGHGKEYKIGPQADFSRNVTSNEGKNYS